MQTGRDTPPSLPQPLRGHRWADPVPVTWLTGDWHVGQDADPRARAALAARGYPLTHAARQTTGAGLEGVDLVLAMDAANLASVAALAPASAQLDG